MPRPRRADRQHLPKHVYLVNGRYVYRRYLGMEDGRPRFAPDARLCSGDAVLDEIWQAYRAVCAGDDAGTLGWLMGAYLLSPACRGLAQATQEMYARNARTIGRMPIKGGRTFGAVRIAATTPGTYRRYMDKRSADGAPVQANRELSYLKSAFAWAFERDLVAANPVAKVTKFRETPRTRYVSDDEYLLVYDLAPPMIRCAMEIAYLCRARLSEIRRLRRSDDTPDGLMLQRSKGSKTQLIGWTPRLRAATALGRQVSGKVMSLDPYIISARGGGPITDSGFKSAWQRAMRKAMKQGLAERFTFHDLKAKGVSDFSGDKSKASGHKTARMTAIYDRRLETVPATK